MTDSEEVTRLREEVDQFLQGQTHLFCALANALERSGALKRTDLTQAIREKITWLEHHNTDIHVATPLLMAEQWVTSPPPDPRDPFDGDHRGYLRPVPRK